MNSSPVRQAVVMCCDAAFLPFALFLAHRITREMPERRFDICICGEEEMTLPPSLHGLDVRMVQIAAGESYRGMKTTHLPRSAYLRLWIADALSDQYDRLLYLDCDVFPENAALADLLSLDIGNRAVGAVRDMQQWPDPGKRVKEFRMMGWPARPYFNSGVLLIDVQRFRTQEVLTRALDFAAAHPEVLLHHDQSLLNCVLYDDWAELSPVWNWQWVAKRPLFSLWTDVQLSHFVTGLKPWRDPKGKVPVRYGKEYEKFFSVHFPEVTMPGPQRPLLPESLGRFFWTLLRHLVVQGRISAYLKRFPDARHVIT